MIVWCLYVQQFVFLDKWITYISILNVWRILWFCISFTTFHLVISTTYQIQWMLLLEKRSLQNDLMHNFTAVCQQRSERMIHQARILAGNISAHLNVRETNVHIEVEMKSDKILERYIHWSKILKDQLEL